MHGFLICLLIKCNQSEIFASECVNLKTRCHLHNYEFELQTSSNLFKFVKVEDSIVSDVTLDYTVTGDNGV